jgi:hypothetical protein
VSNLQLFIGCVAIWGSTWLAITYQLGAVEPEASVTYRFLLASLLLFAYCRSASCRCATRARAPVDRALRRADVRCQLHLRVLRRAAHRLRLVAVGYSASPLLRCSASALSSARR